MRNIGDKVATSFIKSLRLGSVIDNKQNVSVADVGRASRDVDLVFAQPCRKFGIEGFNFVRVSSLVDEFD